VTRRNWLALRSLVACAGGLLLTGALTAVVTWGVPSTVLPGPGRFSFFDAHGLVPSASMLFGLALGTAIGVVVGRTVWATGASLAALIVSRQVFELLRRSYATPVEATAGRRPGALDWVVGEQAGHTLFQPASRFWAFQGIEAGIYHALFCALAAFALWWTVHRAA
jgi:hypothetical protein